MPILLFINGARFLGVGWTWTLYFFPGREMRRDWVISIFHVFDEMQHAQKVTKNP
jgi:hypothetical protein